MAEAIFNTLAEQKGPFFDCSDPTKPIEPKAISAGIYADFGSSAATYAEDAVRDLLGADLSEHRSSKTKEAVVRGSRLILTMTDEHAAYVKSLFPNEAARVFSIYEYASRKGVKLPESAGTVHRHGIPDPYGRNFEVYKQTAKILLDLIEDLFPSILRDMGVCF